MSGLALAVDVGNTNTVIGLFAGRAIRKRWRLPTRKDATTDEVAFWLSGLIRSGESFGPIGASALASVVPDLDEPWTQALAEVFGAAPEVLSHRNCLGLELDYEIPAQIGADRLANVLGAHALGHAEGVVIDLGTATTYDVFDRRAYYGGIICAGIQSTMRALASGASKLYEVELTWPTGAIGKTTDEALRIGILQGTVGQVEYLLRAVLAEKRMKSPSVIATGGLAPLLKGRSKAIGIIEPDLTLIGINHLLLGQSKKKGRKK